MQDVSPDTFPTYPLKGVHMNIIDIDIAEKLGVPPRLAWLFNLPTLEFWGIRIPLHYGVGLLVTLGALYTVGLLVEHRWIKFTDQSWTVRFAYPASAVSLGAAFWLIDTQTPQGQTLWYQSPDVQTIMLFTGCVLAIFIQLKRLYTTWRKMDIKYYGVSVRQRTAWLNAHRESSPAAYTYKQLLSPTAFVRMLIFAVLFYMMTLSVSAAITVSWPLGPNTWQFGLASILMLTGALSWGFLPMKAYKTVDLSDVHVDNGWFPKLHRPLGKLFGWARGLFGSKPKNRKALDDYGSHPYGPTGDDQASRPSLSTLSPSPVDPDKLVAGGARQRRQDAEPSVSRPSASRTRVSSALPQNPPEITQPEPKPEPAPPVHVPATEPPQDVELIDATQASTKTQVVDAAKIAELDPANKSNGARLDFGRKTETQPAPATSSNAGSIGARLSFSRAESPATAPSPTTGSSGARLNLPNRTGQSVPPVQTSEEDAGSNGARLDFKRK